MQAQLSEPLKAWAQKEGVALFAPEGSPGVFEITNQPTLSLEDQLRLSLDGTGYGVLSYRNYAFIILPEARLQQKIGLAYFESLREARLASEEAELAEVGKIGQLNEDGTASLTGLVLDASTNEPIIGAVIAVGDGGTTSDFNGQYTLQLQPGINSLLVSYVGYSENKVKFNLRGNGELNISLLESAQNLEEVVVTGRAADANVTQTIAGISTLDMKQLERGATLLGEADVVRGLLLNPGVTTIGEGASGFNVRGGEVDQNLLLQDEIILFNASHALGFFSTFNSDMVRSVDLYKGGVPPDQSGRLASALAVDMRDGNRERTRWNLTAGPVTGKGLLEGPIKKGRSSYLIGARSSYVNWLLGAVNVPEVQRTRAFFIDGNARLSFRIGDSDGLLISAYGSQDDFVYNQTFGFNYYTRAAEVTYNKRLSGKTNASLSLVASDYFSEQEDLQGLDAASLATGIKYLKSKLAFRSQFSEKFELAYGLHAIRYQVDPGQLSPRGESSLVVPVSIEDQQGLEANAFADASIEVNDRLSLVVGARTSNYRLLGAATVYTYGSEGPAGSEVIDSTIFGAGATIHSETNFDPRASVRFGINDETSLKIAYSRSTQYINQLFNSDSPTPSSPSQLTTKYIPSCRAHSASLGIFKNLQDDNWETSAEVSYREIDRLWDYKDFAQLAANPRLEQEIREGQGRAYGAEFSVKRKTGQWNGWLSYTYSRTERRVPEINQGKDAPSNFDQPHNARMVLTYDLSQRVSFNANFTYSTGRPTTAPITNYRVSNGLIVPVFSERNQVRIPDYHRLDLAVSVGKGYDQTRKVQTKWTISLYNVYGRKNAFSVFYTQSPDQTNVANRLALLGTIFPSLTISLSPT